MNSLLAIFAATLTSLHDLSAIMQEKASGQSARFCITGTVSYVLTYHENLCRLLLEDDDVGVDFYGTIATDPPRAGDVLHLSGEVNPRPPNLVKPEFSEVEILGHVTEPVPAAGTAGEIMSGSHDFRRSYLVGEVRDVMPSGTDPCWNYLCLISDGSLYYVPIPTRGAGLEELAALIGSTVRLDGYPDPHNSSYRFLDERRFVVAGYKHVKILARPPDDPFAKAPSIETLHRLPIESISRLQRHKTAGRLLSVWGDRQALLLLADKRMALISFEARNGFRAIPRRGDSVEVCGYPLTDGFTLHLTHAIARAQDATPFVEPPVMTLTEDDFRGWLPESNHPKSPLQGRRLQLVGSVSDLSDDQRKQGVLPLSIANRLLEVDFSSVPESARDVRSGCRVRVTGTCVLASENWAVLSGSALLSGIRLVLDRPDDLVILAHPPWWTPARFTILIIALALTLFAFYLWNLSLRHLSERRGQALLYERTANALAELKNVERTRLAVELHDSISQTLTGAAMQLDAGEIGTAKRILASCRRELRACLLDLRSNTIDADNLNEAIRDTIAPHLGGRRASVDVDIPSSALSEEIRHAALRIIREATVNAIRHGHASTIAISGELADKTLSFSVVDDGRGFDPRVFQGSSAGHFGLQGMRERAKSFNGTVSVASEPGSGTEISVVLEDRPGYDFGDGDTNKDAAFS